MALSSVRWLLNLRFRRAPGRLTTTTLVEVAPGRRSRSGTLRRYLFGAAVIVVCTTVTISVGAALAAAASAPLGIAVAAGAALSSPNVRDALRRGTVKAVAGAIQATDQITAAVARRATPTDNPPENPEPDA